MGADLVLAMVPAVKLDDKLKAQWDKICDELEEDEVYCDSVDTSDPNWREAIKDWKNTYTSYCEGYRRDVTDREVNGITYLISGHMSWGGDTPDGLNFLSDLENVSALDDWLEKEAKKQAIQKLIPVAPESDISSQTTYANGYFDALVECGISHLEASHLKKIYSCLFDDLDLCIHAPKVRGISEGAARILNKTNWKFRLSYDEPRLGANNQEVLTSNYVEMAIEKYGSGEADEINVLGYYFATTEALEMLAEKRSRVRLGIGYCDYTLSEEGRFVIQNVEDSLLEEKCPDAEYGDELTTINEQPLDTGRIQEIGAVAYYTELYSTSERLDFVFRKEDGDEYRLEFREEDLEIASIKHDIVINDENAETLLVIANREVTSAYSSDKYTPGLHQPFLTDLTSRITDSLSRHEYSRHEYVSFNGLKELTEEQATILCKSEGTLCLDGLKEISASLADILATNQGSLDIDGITSLSTDCAKALSKHKGDLSLGGLTNLSDEAAHWLSMHEGDELSLDGLHEIAEPVAETLARAKEVKSLDFKGVTEISDEVAAILARFKGNLSFGIVKLSDAAALSFAEHEGILGLDEVKTVSDTGAEALSKHKGIVGLEGCIGISDKARKLLGECEDIYLP